MKALADRGFMIVTANLADDVDSLAETLKGFDILISAINARFILDQVKLVDAAAKAGIKRFVPCDFAVVVPPGGVMSLRDEKEVVHQRICKWTSFHCFCLFRGLWRDAGGMRDESWCEVLRPCVFHTIMLV